MTRPRFIVYQYRGKHLHSDRRTSQLKQNTAVMTLEVELYHGCAFGKRKLSCRFKDSLALIKAHADELRALGVRRIGVFGFFARGEAMAESNVDVYLEFVKGRKTYNRFFVIYEWLQKLVRRPIDLVTDGSLSERKARIIIPPAPYAILNAFP